MPLNAHLAVLTACFFWGISFIASKTALTAMPPLTVVLSRLLVSSLCFALWLGCRGRGRQTWRLLHNRRMALTLFVLALFSTSLHYGLQTVGLKYTSAANASLYALTGPLSILVISMIFLGEKLTGPKALGMATAVTGVVTVMGWQTLREFDLTGHLLGDLLVFASIFMWGVFTVMSKGLTSHTRHPLPALELTALTTWIGTLQIAPFALMENYRSGFQLAYTTPPALLSILFLGITCSFLATWLYVLALEKGESQKVGVYLYTIPPITFIFAALFLGEQITLRLLLGSLLVAAGVWLTERRRPAPVRQRQGLRRTGT